MTEVSAVTEATAAAKPAQAFKEVKSPPWVDQPIDHKWLEGKLFPPGVKALLKSEARGGYSHFVLNNMTSEEGQMLGYQQEVEGAANKGNAEYVRGHMTDKGIGGLLSQEYKIHIQPKREFVPLVAHRLGTLLQDEEVRKLVGEFKVKIDPGGVDSQG